MRQDRDARFGDSADRKRGRWRLRAAGILVAAALVGAAVVAAVPSALAATLFSDDFQDGNSTGWTTSGGTWSVVSDAGSLVFRQSGTGADALARAGSSSWTDYTASAAVEPLAFGASNRFVALLARVQSNTSYYFLALQGDGTLVLGRRTSGTLTTLASAPFAVTTGTRFALSLGVSGSSLTGSVVGGPTLTATDSQFATGQVGFATRFAAGEIDDVLVASGAPSPSPTPTGTPTPTPTPTATPTPTPTGSCGVPAGEEGWATVNGATTGGCGGPTVTVTSLAQLETEAAKSTPEIILVNGLFTGSGEVTVKANKSIIGVGASSGLTGIGLSIEHMHPANVIVQNMNISKVTASSGDGDAVHIQDADHVWVDHNSLSSDLDHGTDFYDGLVDITHAGDFITVSWNHNFNHVKDSLLGHSDTNGSEDTGHLRVTYHHNWYDNTKERHPRVRFGDPVHVYDNYVLNADYGVASVENGGTLVEDNVFENVTQACFSASGFADSGPGRLVAVNNQLINSGVCETNGTVAAIPYAFHLDDVSVVKSLVMAGAGAGHTGQ
ncbi:MAG TPA: pectate lyase [Candidatus Dormibacteraeota bacterium]|nr:pectate lyase [Candidatus Dormibacteraeota bacterium]